MKEIVCYSDGSATMAKLHGGYGWVLVVDGIKHSEGSGHMPSASNNDAETQASIEALKAAYTLIYSIFPPTHTNVLVTLCSDSQIVLGWADGSYKFKQTEPEKIERYKQLSSLMAILNAKTRWVKGHSGDEHNERCDVLAGEARTGIKKKGPKKAKKPRKFKWNDLNKEDFRFWVPETNKEFYVSDSDKNIINNFNGKKVEDIVGALCRIASELIEIEESRNNK
jgi:ribonuclease HI